MAEPTPIPLSPPVAEMLRQCVAINLDSAKGFAEAARRISDPSLQVAFTEIAAVRRTHIDELRAWLPEAEIDAMSGSVLATAHRWWLDLRAWLTDGDAYAILAEVERGEDAIKHRYDDLVPQIDCAELAGTLRRHLSEIQAAVEQQHREVRRTHDRMRDLRDESAS